MKTWFKCRCEIFLTIFILFFALKLNVLYVLPYGSFEPTTDLGSGIGSKIRIGIWDLGWMIDRSIDPRSYRKLW